MPELTTTEHAAGTLVESVYLGLKMITRAETESQIEAEFQRLMLDCYQVLNGRGPKTEEETILIVRLGEYISYA